MRITTYPNGLVIEYGSTIQNKEVGWCYQNSISIFRFKTAGYWSYTKTSRSEKNLETKHKDRKICK